MKEMKYWIVKPGEDVSLCKVCGASLIFVPYGGHPLSRIWNRVGPGETLICCPNGCKEGDPSKPRKICREELTITSVENQKRRNKC